MEQKLSYILVLDVGTTNIKTLAFSKEGEILEKKEKRTNPTYPHPGWAEQDPMDIIDTVYDLIDEVDEKLGSPEGIALTNQRSTTTVWNRETGEPLHNMITWQDTRTEELAEDYSSNPKIRLARGVGKIIKPLSNVLPFLKKSKRGNFLSTLAHFDFGTTHSSMHLRWLMDNVSKVQEAVNSGAALFGTIDTWIAWNLTGKHVTDYTNASATGLFDPAYLKWSDNISKIVDIPKKILPELVPNDKPIGRVERYETPLLTTIADQQASLYMSGIKRGTINITNGTGSFIDLNVGERITPGKEGVYPLIAIKTKKKALYLLEGSVNAVGSAIDWLIELGLMDNYSDISKAFEESKEECKLTFLPALSGLSSPYMKPGLKGTIFEVTKDTTREDFIKSLILGIAMRCSEVIKTLETSSGIKAEKIIADGGASESNDFIQSIADLSEKEISRPQHLNGSAYGTYMLAKNVLNDKDPISEWKPPKIDKPFKPRKNCHQNFKNSWQETVEPICKK